MSVAPPPPPESSTGSVTTEDIRAASSWVEPLRAEIGRVLVGQELLVERLLIAMLTNGHVLLEGVPGLAKTGPSRAEKVPSRGLKIIVPTTSAGSRSGVNWIR